MESSDDWLYGLFGKVRANMTTDTESMLRLAARLESPEIVTEREQQASDAIKALVKERDEANAACVRLNKRVRDLLAVIEKGEP